AGAVAREDPARRDRAAGTRGADPRERRPRCGSVGGARGAWSDEIAAAEPHVERAPRARRDRGAVRRGLGGVDSLGADLAALGLMSAIGFLARILLERGRATQDGDLC